MHSLVQKILGTCERVANIFLHPGANYTYMYNLHTVCKSAHVNGARDSYQDYKYKYTFLEYMYIQYTDLVNFTKSTFP